MPSPALMCVSIARQQRTVGRWLGGSLCLVGLSWLGLLPACFDGAQKPDDATTTPSGSLSTTTDESSTDESTNTLETTLETSSSDGGSDTSLGSSTESATMTLSTTSSNENTATTTTDSTASSSGDSSTSDTTSTSTATPCTWRDNDNECGAGYYCNAPGCTSGVCQKIPSTDSNERTPVCGCNSVNYYNANVAAALGMALKQEGQCPEPSTCGGIAGVLCPDKIYCGGQREDDMQCNLDIPSQCWGMPKVCADDADKSALLCGQNTCMSECEATKSGSAWYYDVTFCNP